MFTLILSLVSLLALIFVFAGVFIKYRQLYNYSYMSRTDIKKIIEGGYIELI